MAMYFRGNRVAPVVGVKYTPPTPSGGYTRPSDWLTIPDFDETKDEIYILNGVGLHCLNQIYFKLSVSDITDAVIDWGDGHTETVSARETIYSHKYNYNDFGDSSYTEHNQTKQALIHIYAPRGNITLFSTGSNMSYKYTNADGIEVFYSYNISTDIYEINGNVQESGVYCSSNSNQQSHANLEIFDWKGSITNTSMSSMFHSCYSLQSIPQLDTSQVTNMSYMFEYCYSLQSIPQLDTSQVTNMSYMFYDCYSLQNPKVYNAGSSTQSSITLSNFSGSRMMTKQALVDLFNSLAINPSLTRTLQLGSTLQGYLSNCYVKDSSTLYDAILPTRDTTIDTSKTYYTYNAKTGLYIQFTGSTFETGTFYYELKTASWNRYDICESTDEGAMLALDFVRNIKKWTVS